MLFVEARDTAPEPPAPSASDSIWKRPGFLAQFVVAVLIAVVALVPLVFGFQALIAAPAPPGKALGAVLGVFAAAAIAPVFFFPDRPHRDFARLWGSAAGIAAATLALYEQYTVGDRTQLVYVWWALLGLSVTGLILALYPKPDLGKREFWAGVAAVATSTVVVGLVQYWWRTYYEPLRVAPVLTVTAKVKAANATGGVVPLDVTITVKNPTTVAVRPLASLFAVSGFRSAGGTLSTNRLRRMIKSSVSGTPEASSVDRYHLLKRTLVAAGPLFPADEVIPAGETRKVHLIVDLPSPKPRFTDAALGVQIAFVQAEQLALGRVFHPVHCTKRRSPTTGQAPTTAQAPKKTQAAKNATTKAEICKDFAQAGRPYTSAIVTEWQIPSN